jgi:hypothetical protein
MRGFFLMLSTRFFVPGFPACGLDSRSDPAPIFCLPKIFVPRFHLPPGRRWFCLVTVFFSLLASQILTFLGLLYSAPQCYKIRWAVKNRLPPILLYFEKIVENWENSAEMQLTCERNRKISEL